MKIRADEILVIQKLAQTRSQAKQLILQGLVFHKGKEVTKPAQLLDRTEHLTLKTEEQYVSRGAYKLKGAIEKFKISAAQKTIADIGASTGGFTDYLLQNGASKVYAIDVGHSQLAPKIAKNPRVINLEKTNIKDLKDLPEKVDLVVIDLSFISIRHAIPNAKNFLKEDGEIVALFKPQFEAGKEALGKDGVIKDPELAERSLQEFIEWCGEQNIKVKEVIPSSITGKRGNQEYLLHLI